MTSPKGERPPQLTTSQHRFEGRMSSVDWYVTRTTLLFKGWKMFYLDTRPPSERWSVHLKWTSYSHFHHSCKCHPVRLIITAKLFMDKNELFYPDVPNLDRSHLLLFAVTNISPFEGTVGCPWLKWQASKSVKKVSGERVQEESRLQNFHSRQRNRIL